MFSFLDTQLATLKNNDESLDNKLKAHKKATLKLEKIKSILMNPDAEEIKIDENNLDETLTSITHVLEDIDIDAMKTEDLKKIISIRTKIENCKKFLSEKQIVKVFIHDKEQNIEEITHKMKEGLFIEQIKS